MRCKECNVLVKDGMPDLCIPCVAMAHNTGVIRVILPKVKGGTCIAISPLKPSEHQNSMYELLREIRRAMVKAQEAKARVDVSHLIGQAKKLRTSLKDAIEDVNYFATQSL